MMILPNSVSALDIFVKKKHGNKDEKLDGGDEDDGDDDFVMVTSPFEALNRATRRRYSTPASLHQPAVVSALRQASTEPGLNHSAPQSTGAGIAQAPGSARRSNDSFNEMSTSALIDELPDLRDCDRLTSDLQARHRSSSSLSLTTLSTPSTTGTQVRTNKLIKRRARHSMDMYSARPDFAPNLSMRRPPSRNRTSNPGHGAA